MQRTVDNMLKNHLFTSSATGWTYEALGGTGTGGYATDKNDIAGGSYKLNKTSDSGEISVYQTAALKKGSTYTFSTH